MLPLMQGYILIALICETSIIIKAVTGNEVESDFIESIGYLYFGSTWLLFFTEYCLLGITLIAIGCISAYLKKFYEFRLVLLTDTCICIPFILTYSLTAQIY